MADFGIIATIASIAGAGVSAYGQMQAGQAQAKAANYQAQVAANNATIAEQNASAAARAGAVQAQAAGIKAAQTGGLITASLAANGVDVNSGSAEDVQRSSKEVGMLDQLTVMNNAMLQAYGYKTQATGYQAQAGLDKATAQDAGSAGSLSAAGGLLGSAGSIGLKWLGMQNSTPTSGNLPITSTLYDNAP